MLETVILVCVITILTILVHYEFINLVEHWDRSRLGGVRFRIIIGVFLLFLAHSTEIFLFAGAIYFAKNTLLLGSLEGAFSESAHSYVYFSVVTYTSLGYGDISPIGYIRMISGFEALVGLLMMAWSAAYTVSRLQNIWQTSEKN